MAPVAGALLLRFLGAAALVLAVAALVLAAASTLSASAGCVVVGETAMVGRIKVKSSVIAVVCRVA